MHIKRQIATLKKIYALYDRYAGTLDMVCEKFCDTCCTCNITLTTAEARVILSETDARQQQDLRRRLHPQLNSSRFIPKITTNRLADLCRSGAEPPEEAIDPAWGPCPLLSGGTCSIYDVRPFGCRCMLSTACCAHTGAAVIDEFTFTVNTLFLQSIEHADASGFTGNLADLLMYMTTGDSADAADAGLIQNRPAPVLMIPPEHQEKIRPILAELNLILQSSYSTRPPHGV